MKSSINKSLNGILDLQTKEERYFSFKKMKNQIKVFIEF